MGAKPLLRYMTQGPAWFCWRSVRLLCCMSFAMLSIIGDLGILHTLQTFDLGMHTYLLARGAVPAIYMLRLLIREPRLSPDMASTCRRCT